MKFEITARQIEASPFAPASTTKWVGVINGQSYGSGETESEAIERATEILSSAIKSMGSEAFFARLADQAINTY